MAFAIKKREEKQPRTEYGLLDVSLMQNLQNRFCDANNVYLVCLSKKRGVITKAYGSKEELNYLHMHVTMDMHVSLLNKMIDNRIENVIEEECGTDAIKMCGVSIRVGGETVAIWVVTGVMEDDTLDAPSCIMRTTPERFYKSIEFLETLSKQMFAVKLEELMAQEAFLKSRESEQQMEAELHRNEVMTNVVKMLESEKSFVQIVEDVLKNVCEYMDISSGALMQENVNPEYVDVICEYASPENEALIDRLQRIEKTKYPFFNGKPYMVSANSMMPDEFHHMFEEYGTKAGIFLPIEVNGRSSLYLCFMERHRERIWDMNDIKFVNDVKRIIQSILVKRVAKNSLASSYASLEAILENMVCGIYVKDPVSNTILYTNQRFRDSFYKSNESGVLDTYMEELLESGQNSFREFYYEEENRWFDFHSTRINWVDGRTVSLCTIYDVTDKKMYQQKIERQANNDFLTGLYNRMRCEQDLERYIGQATEFGKEGALLYLDLDDFKHINDGLGHQYGDVLLKDISNNLQKIPGVENTCYRMGGDEFIVILPHHYFSMLHEVIEEIRSIFSKPWMLKGTDYYCTMSMGVVKFPTDGTTVEELIQKADIALYEAKMAGKNRVEFYNENVESTSFKRLDLEKNMRNATRYSFDEFEVYYQPVVDVTKPDNPCIGAEALIRWNSPELGFVSPVDFVPMAEYLGLIIPIGDYVLKQACIRCKYWNDYGHPDYKVNVNLSVVQLLQNDIVDKIEKVLKETGITPRNLNLEVTESLAINDMNRMKTILADIRHLGVRVALDDFGTGYSSLNHIRELPIDIIKIDRCFVIDIAKDEFSDSFVKMVSQLADVIGVKICVEGVETKEQVEKVKQCGVHMIQGFYFGKPMRAADFEEKYL